MTWTQHKEFHSSSNSLRWKVDIKYANKMKKIFSERLTRMMKDKEFVANMVQKGLEERKTLTPQQRKLRYGNCGEKNGMYGNGFKLNGKRNGRWRTDINHVSDINMDEYENAVCIGLSKRELSKKFNLINRDVSYLNNVLCDKYGVNRIEHIILLNKLDLSGFNIDVLRTEVNNLLLNNINPLRNLNQITTKFKLKWSDISRFLKIKKYKTFTDFCTSNNHRILKIEYYGETNAYDLVNTGENHIYAIESKDGSKVFCHNCSTKNEYGDILTIKSSDENIKSILYNLFYDVLNIQFNLWPWTRNMLKYGDTFLKLDITEKYGIVNVIPLSVYETTREEGFNPANPFDVRFRQEGPMGAYTYRNYEIAHIRLLSDTNFAPYGKSIIEPGRKLWKMLTLMEDAMLINRIMRAPERRIFYVDIGNIAPDEVDSYMNLMISSMKKTPFVDQTTGDYNLRFNMMNMLEDYYLPVRGQFSNTKIDTLPGMEFNGMDDIEYLRKRLLSSIRMPNPFLGYEESVEGKATLAALDVRFGRTIERIQNALVSELIKIAIIHLYAQGFTDAKLVDFEISLTQPSTIYEAEKINLWSEKIRVGREFFESKLFSDDWVYKNVFNMSDDEIKKEKANSIEAIKLLFRKTQIENEGNDPQVSKQSFGTPHDLATMNLQYGRRFGNGGLDFGSPEFNPNPNEPRPGGVWSRNPYTMQPIYQNPAKSGRPPEPMHYNTDKYPTGRDTLGKKDMDKALKKREVKPNYKNPLREEDIEDLKKTSKTVQRLFEENEVDKTKDIMKEDKRLDKDNGDYLDEKNIIDDETFE